MVTIETHVRFIIERIRYWVSSFRAGCDALQSHMWSFHMEQAEGSAHKYSSKRTF